MISILNVIMTTLWPFVKEMVLKGKSVRESLKENKKGVAFAFFVMGLVWLVFFLGSRVVEVSHENVILQKKYDEVVKGTQGSKRTPIQDGVELKQNTELPKSLKPTEPPADAKQAKADSLARERYKHFRDTLESIKKREEQIE